MHQKSEEGLMDYLNNFQRYVPDAISAAVEELKSRGKNFTEAELEAIRAKIDKRIKAVNDDDDPFGSSPNEVVTDAGAPELYSKGAITGFSIFFSPIFGAVLLASNVEDSGNKWIVIIFGLICTGVMMPILIIVPLALPLNALGGAILTSYFWNKYIGVTTKYRAKSVLGPLIISIVITIPLLIAVISAG